MGGLLFVCYANLCRSPMAEHLARTMLAKHAGLGGAGVAVSSAGTHATPGWPMHPHAAQVVAARGGDPEPFRTRVLTTDLITGADLVLTATREQRAVCAALAPGRAGQVFTLRQFGRLARQVGPDREPAGTDPVEAPEGRPAGPALPALVAALARGRSRVQPVPPAEDDLADPVGRPLRQFERCADQIEQILAPVVDLIVRPG